MIPLTNYDFQWARSELVIIYPEQMRYHTMYWNNQGLTLGSPGSPSMTFPSTKSPRSQQRGSVPGPSQQRQRRPERGVVRCGVFWINGRSSGSNRWRYVSTIFLAIYCGDIPWNLGLKKSLIYGRYLQFRFLKWPLIGCHKSQVAMDMRPPVDI